MQKKVKIVECPRDGMQGIQRFIPTPKKIEFLGHLLDTGFDVIDAGSFVSSAAISQMKDTYEVLQSLEPSGKTKVMVLAGNEKRAEQAAHIDIVDSISFPFSISEYFLQKNIRSNKEKALHTIDIMNETCVKNNKEFIVYITMAFGNPYGDDWSYEILYEAFSELVLRGIRTIPLSDITGESNPEQIFNIYNHLSNAFPETETGLHLHTPPYNFEEKLNAAWDGGCKRFDSVIGGFGGCPMTGSGEMLSNLNTESLLKFLKEKDAMHSINQEKFQQAQNLAAEIYSS